MPSNNNRSNDHWGEQKIPKSLLLENDTQIVSISISIINHMTRDEIFSNLWLLLSLKLWCLTINNMPPFVIWKMRIISKGSKLEFWSLLLFNISFITVSNGFGWPLIFFTWYHVYRGFGRSLNIFTFSMYSSLWGTI